MPLARIVTSQEADAATICEYFHKLGYVVEVVGPDDPNQGDAELEIELDRVPVAEALEFAAQRSHDLNCDVWVAPGAIAPVSPGDLEPLPDEEAHVPAEFEKAFANWQPEPVLADQNWEDEPEPVWTEASLLTDSQVAEPEAEQIRGTAVEALSSPPEPEHLAVPLRERLAAALTACKQQGAIISGSFFSLVAAGVAFSRRCVSASASMTNQWVSATQQSLKHRRDSLRERRQAEVRQREASEKAAFAELQRTALNNAETWEEIAATETLSAASEAATRIEQVQPPRPVPVPRFESTASLPEASVWIAPEVSKVSPPAVSSETRPTTLSPRLAFWRSSSTNPELQISKLRRPPRLREVQWRRAAALSGVLAMGLMVAFAASLRPTASSLLPESSSVHGNPEPSRSAEAAPARLVALEQLEQNPSEPLSLEMPNKADPENMQAAPASALRQESRPRETRTAQRSIAGYDDVRIRHFGPNVVIRHFEPAGPPASASRNSTTTNGVRYYSDLD